MLLNRQVRDIPDGDAVPGASMQISRATDGVSVGSASTDADGFATLTANGSPGPVKARFLKGSTIWSDDSRSLMAVGSHSLAELRDLINYLHTDGVVPWGNQFSQSSGIHTFTVSTGAVVLDGVLAVFWSASTVATTDGDMAIVIRQANADGRTELAAINYSDIGSTTCVPLWRCTVTSGSASNVTWIGVRTLRGINNYHQCQTGIVRAASGSTTSASGEASALTTTLTLDTGVHYQVTAKASLIARARDGALAIEINGNLSSYRTNSGDVTVTLKNAHVRDVTGAGACVVTVYHRSDTALTDWVNLANYGAFGSGTAPNFNTPAQTYKDASSKIWVGDTGNNRAVRLNTDGSHDTAITSLTGITAVAVAANGKVWVGYGTTLARYSSSLVFEDDFVTGIAIKHMAARGSDMLVTHGDGTIRQYEQEFVSGDIRRTNTYGGSGTGNGQFNTPWGVFFSASEIYVVDSGNNRVQVLNGSGVYQRQWSIPANSRGIAADASGDLWVAVYGSNELRQYSNTGTLLNTITQATPDGIAITTGDVLWISNVGGHSIAKVDETAAAFTYDAALLSAIAVPRT